MFYHWTINTRGMFIGFILHIQAGGRMLGIQMIPNNVIVSEQVIMGREA
jgi:hypothetical protein